MTIPAIPDVIAYGQAQRHHMPLTDAVTVSTRSARIEIDHPDIGALSLTTEQSVNLRERLEQAERDLDAAEGRSCEASTLTEPAPCDCCGRAMAISEPVATFWDERLGDVVMHAGQCPEPDLWRVERTWARINAPVLSAAMPFEEAFASAAQVRRLSKRIVTRIRLVRVREARP